MEQDKYVQDFISISRVDYDSMWSVMPEFAHHFERCVGVVSCSDDVNGLEWDRHAFVYDPHGEIAMDSFQESVQFVEENMAILCQKLWYENSWESIKRDLEMDRAPYVYSEEPKMFSFDGMADLPRLIPIYDRAMFGQSRTYGLTSRGKLVPLSHGSHYQIAPYDNGCFEKASELLEKMLVVYEIVEKNNRHSGLAGHERFIPKSKADFSERFPDGNVHVVVKEEVGLKQLYIASVRGRRCYDEVGNEVLGNLYLYKDGIDYDKLSVDIISSYREYFDACEKYEILTDEIKSIMARCRRGKA